MAQLLAGQRDSLTVGGMVFTNLTSLIVLGGTIFSNTRCTPRSLTAGTGYTPSGATAFRLRMISIVCTAAMTNQWAYGYNNNNLGIDSSSALSTPIYAAGTTVAGQYSTGPGGAGETFRLYTPSNFVVANGKYGFVELTGAGAGPSIQWYGYEQ